MSASRDDPTGFLAIVLHAHLPFVREPDHERFLEETWLYEAVIESYLPLLLTLESMVQDGVDFRLTLSLTPPLISMLDDPLLRDRCQRRLEALLELSEEEIARHAGGGPFRDTARFYRDRLETLRDYYVRGCGRDLVGACRRLQDRGRLEILASAATHGFLPLLRHEPASVRAQVRVGVELYRRRFGRQPQGFWLPECAYYPGLDEVLAAEGLRYFLLEAHGVLHGSSRARHGVHAPIVCASGVAAFARDPECSRQVWSSFDGFPGHPDYREFYWDIGYSLPAEELAGWIGPDGVRTATGIKHHRVTGQTDQKEPYVRERALQQAARHADQFLEWRLQQARWLRERMDRPPIVVAPYDAELFGHWWYEGPEWLQNLLRRIAGERCEIVTVTPAEYLAEFPGAQAATPSASTWGAGGYHEVWLNGTNDWIYPRLDRVTAMLVAEVTRDPGSTPLRRRILQQATRELLLAQSSDWAFILKAGTATQYALARLEEHLGSAGELLDWLVEGGTAQGEPRLDGAAAARLAALEAKDNIFLDLDPGAFADVRPRPDFAVRRSPRHAALIAGDASSAALAADLAAALGQLGVRTTVAAPAAAFPGARGRPARGEITVPWGGEPVAFHLEAASDPATGGRRLLLAEASGIDPRRPARRLGANGPRRAATLARAALEAIRWQGEAVDVVHAIGPDAALSLAYLKLCLRGDPILGQAAGVLSPGHERAAGPGGREALLLAGFGSEVVDAAVSGGRSGSFAELGRSLADRISALELGRGCPRPKAEARAELLGALVGRFASAAAPLVGLDVPGAGVEGLDLVERGLTRILSLGVNLVLLEPRLANGARPLGAALERRPDRILALARGAAGASLLEEGADILLSPGRPGDGAAAATRCRHSGTMLVAARSNGVPKEATNGQVTYSFPASDLDSLVAALARAVQAYYDLRREPLPRGGSSTAAVPWAAHAARHLEVYRQALADRR